MLDPRTATVHAATVREFLHIVTAQAKAALAGIDQPGFLQISRLHPSSELLVPSRFVLDDVERMIDAAVTDSEAGHNVYCEGRTVRPGLRGNARGTLADTVAVFALVVDSDADKQMGWSPTVPVSMTVTTSPGNFQFWFFFREAVSAETGKKLGERIRAAVNSDHDTGTITQPYRIAGTVNYPSAKKIERGRTTVPTQLVEFDPEVLWTPEQIEQAFPLPERKTDGGSASADTAEEASIPDETMKVIRDGVPKNQRSDAFWNVMLVLKQAGWNVDATVALLEKYPDGIAQKYRGRLRQQIEHVYGKIKNYDVPKQQQKQSIAPAPSTEALKTMIFVPIKHVVPDIFVEGLTLFAGKPKIGKSWLLLHAAIAVARNGFTLGNLHCIEGDVLYCALEDNERRLQSRITKLLGISQDWPARLFYYCQLPRLAEGGLDTIRAWIESVPYPRLVIIDTLAMVRAPKKRDETNYDADYAAVLELRKLANEFGIAIVLVHHLRKAEADDAFDTISGTLGLTGAPDTVLVLKRDTTGHFVLHGRGRDLIEIEKAMTFDAETCVWQIAGDAAALRRSTERAAILEAVEEAGEPIGPNNIAAATGMKAGSVRRLLGKLAKEGVIEKAGYGKYRRCQKTAA